MRSTRSETVSSDDRPTRRAAATAPVTPGRRALATAISLVVVAVAAIAGVGPAGVAGASVAGTSTVTGGFPPEWALDVDDSPVVEDQRGFAVDRLGNSYVAHGRTVMQMFSPEGATYNQAEALGPGTISPWGLAVSDDLDVTVVGYLDGQVTIGSAPHQVTLTGADANTQFMIQFDRTGAINWSRTFGGGNAGAIRPLQLHQQGDMILLNGSYVNTIEIDGLTLDQPLSQFGFGSGLLAGFDAATGEAQWLTAIDLTVADVNKQVRPMEGAVGDSAFAVVAYAGADVEVRGPDDTIDADCTGLLPNGGCDLLVVVDPETGNPTLARALEEPTDTLVLENIALVDDGYVIAGSRYQPFTATWGGSYINRLDADGDIVWSTTLTGQTVVNGLEVDGNGDVLAAATLLGSTTIGTGPGATTVTASSAANVLLVELDGSGDLMRWTSGGGTGTDSAGVTNPSLAIGPEDQIMLTGTMFPGITLGSGSGAVSLVGTGSFLASFRADSLPPGSTFHATTPTRLLDSRTSTGGWNGKLVAGTTRELKVAGVAGVPDDATAVVLNLTATDVINENFLEAWPTGLVQPTASNLNVFSGDTISNHATVQVGADESITLLAAQGSMHVVADLLGYYTPDDSGDGYRTLTPTRVLDSRIATGWNGALQAGSPRQLTVAGTAGIPAGADAVVLSVTVTDTSDLTYLRVQPAGSTASNSNIAVNAGQTITNLVTTRIGAGGQLTFTNNTGRVNVVADAVGYYDDAPGGASFHPTAPTRIYDSRDVIVPPFGPGEVRTASTTSIAPAGTITAVAANLTATQPSEMSLAILYPQAPRPATSNLLYTPGQTVAAAANTGVAPNGTVSIYNQLGTVHLILDVNGFFVDP